MKKRTKKKLAKYSKKTLVGLLKLVIYYPLKALWLGVKYLSYQISSFLKKRKEQQQKKGLEQQRPNNRPHYDSPTEIKNKKGTFSSFENKLFNNKSTIGLILGARGSGKSAIGMRLLENIAAKTSKKMCALGFKPESLPQWITSIKDINEIENDSFILIDEGGIEFSSRKAMSSGNKLLSELLLIARHKDLSVLFITQNSANLEINAIRQADYLLLKPSSLLQKDFERKKIKEIYESAQQDFEELKGTTGLTYIYSDSYLGFVTNSLPSFWSEKVSKGYAHK